MRAPFFTVAAVSVLSLGGAIGARFCGVSVLQGPSRIDSRPLAIAASLAGGVGLALLTIVVSRWLVRTRPWARSLAQDLGTNVVSATDAELAIFALASGVGEELLFRGLGVQLVGVLASSVAFALLHQKRGAGRVGWILQAFAFGLAFGWLFWVTGEIVGNVVGHVLVNFVNLRNVRGLSKKKKRSVALGGLLSRGPARAK